MSLAELKDSVLALPEKERHDLIIWLNRLDAQGEIAEREGWLAEGRRQYTPEVCEQTLKINEELPVHEE